MSYHRSLKDVLEKIPAHKKAIAKQLKIAMLFPTVFEHVCPQDTEKLFCCLGKVLFRRRNLATINKMVSDAWGTSIPPRIDELRNLMDLTDKQIDLLYKMLGSIALKKDKEEMSQVESSGV